MAKLLILLLLPLALLLAAGDLLKENVTVAVAANAQYALKEIEAQYEEETGQDIDIIVGSSGKLSAQIMHGAPFDLFLSADMLYPDALHKRGFTLAAPKVYGYGALVLWTMKDAASPLKMSSLLSPQVKAVAIANPKVAPYGEAAVSALKYYKLYQQLKPKLVYGESISQVTQYINSQAADMGLTAKSVVLSPEMKGKGKWMELDNKSYRPIAQGAVLLKRSTDRNKAGAARFYSYLFSDKAKSIFQKYGYQFPK